MLFVGDFRDDLLCGGLAGCVTVLLKNPSNTKFEDLAHLSIDTLSDLIQLLENGFEVEQEKKLLLEEHAKDLNLKLD